MHWRYTAKSPVLGPLDARVVVGILPAMAWWSWYTLAFAVALIVLLGLLSLRKMPVPVALRTMRRLLADTLSPGRIPGHRPGMPAHQLVNRRMDLHERY